MDLRSSFALAKVKSARVSSPYSTEVAVLAWRILLLVALALSLALAPPRTSEVGIPELSLSLFRHGIIRMLGLLADTRSLLTGQAMEALPDPFLIASKPPWASPECTGFSGYKENQLSDFQDAPSL